MVKKFSLPDLPYDYNALEPVISAEIMHLHHDKHHLAYVNNLNAALEKYADAEAKEDLAAMVAIQPAIRFNGGGHLNHSIFWTNLAAKNKGGGGQPEGELADAIKEAFGSFQTFVEKMNAMTGGIQGSGWGWLGFNKAHNHLILTTCANQDPLSTQGFIPLLGIDVWEHAYYPQYKNARPEYLKAIWEVINWKNVAERYTAAAKQLESAKK